MLVSVAIFSVVMIIALGALLVISESNRKAETVKSVTNNLNFSLDSMARVMRTSSDWSCGLGQYVDCPTANGTVLRATVPKDVIYMLSTDSATCGQPSGAVGCLVRSTNSGTNYYPITSPEVVITNAKFYVKGLPLTDGLQPRAIIALSGYIIISGDGACGTTAVCSNFSIQTSVTQRLYDQ